LVPGRAAPSHTLPRAGYVHLSWAGCALMHPYRREGRVVEHA